MGRKKKEDIFKMIKNGCETDFSGVKFKLYLLLNVFENFYIKMQTV